MPRPVRRGDNALLGPAERVELIVDFAAAAGESVELRSGPHRGGNAVSGARPYVGALMQFRVDSATGARPDQGPPPAAAAAGLDPAGLERKPGHSWEIRSAASSRRPG